MRSKTMLMAAGMAVAFGTFSTAAFAEPPSLQRSMPMTSNARIVATDRRLDQFIERRDIREDSRLYANRDATRVAMVQTTSTYRPR